MNEIEKLKKIERVINSINFGGILRRVDELGRIVLPIEYRKGKIEEGKTKLTVYQLGDYAIVELLEEQAKSKKRIDELGRAVINKEIRDNLEWKSGDYVEIWNVEKYYILKKLSVDSRIKKQIERFERDILEDIKVTIQE